MKWNSVFDKLPPVNKEVLVCYIEDKYRHMAVMSMVEFEGMRLRVYDLTENIYPENLINDYVWSDGNGDEAVKFSLVDWPYWMELPAYPEVKSDETA